MYKKSGHVSVVPAFVLVVRFRTPTSFVVLAAPAFIRRHEMAMPHDIETSPCFFVCLLEAPERTFDGFAGLDHDQAILFHGSSFGPPPFLLAIPLYWQVAVPSSG